MFTEPKVIKGGIAVDDRGKLVFVNDFEPSSMKRFYIVSNHSRNFVRAWHGHRNEHKAAIVISGTAILAAVKLEDLEHSKNAHHEEMDLSKVHRFVLSANAPSILLIPPGYANGFKSLTDDTAIMYFSSSSLDDAKLDDIRYDKALFENVWNVIER